MKIRTPLALALLTLAVVASAQNPTVTTTQYRVTQSVGSLSLGQPGIADPYLFLDFQLTDGAGIGNGNSSVTISNLRLTGGAFDYDNRLLADIGNVVGTGDAFTLFGDARLSDRSVLFRVTDPNAVLSYDLTLYRIGDPEPQRPFDAFTASLLYRTGQDDFDVNVVPTTGRTNNEFVDYIFDGQEATTTPSVNGVLPSFATLRTSLGDRRFNNLGVPVVTQAVPEPASIAALGVGALALLRRRRR